MKTLHRIIAALFALATPIVAQNCPDLELERVPQNVQVGPTVDCNSPTYQWRDIRVGAGVVGCPTFVLIQPGYDSTRHRPGSNTYARPSGRVAITQLTFSCELSVFLFIPISSVCNLFNERVIGHRTTYDFHPCAQLQTAAAPLLSGE